MQVYITKELREFEFIFMRRYNGKKFNEIILFIIYKCASKKIRILLSKKKIMLDFINKIIYLKCYKENVTKNLDRYGSEKP